MRRKRMSPRKSRKLFARTAIKTNKRNLRATVMRGGYRM